MNVHVFLLVFFLIFSLALLCALCWPHQGSAQSRAEASVRTTLHRLLKPRTPDDCPSCRHASTGWLGAGPVPAPVRPWCEVKSRREAPKRIDTQGFACPNQQCTYFGITDADIHALVGDGKHGRAERIQTFCCQACHTTFSARRDTPLYRLKTPSQQVAMVLTALAEGLDPSAAERVFGFRQATITRLSDARWATCPTLARTLLLPSPAPTPATRRTAHPAAQRHAGALAVIGHRSLHENSSGAPTRPPSTNYGPSTHPLTPTETCPRLPPTLYQ